MLELTEFTTANLCFLLTTVLKKKVHDPSTNIVPVPRREAEVR